MHVLDGRFGFKIDFNELVDKIMRYCPRTKNYVDLKLMLREMFMSHYQLFDFYDEANTIDTPFASSMIHEIEDTSGVWYYGDLMLAYAELGIGDIFKINYHEFISQPKPIIDEQTEFAKFYQSRKAQAENEILNELKNSKK